jgi:hypothetical protein
MGGNEFMHRYYQKEEEFLDEYGDVASVASKLLGDEWSPNYDCDDRDRHNRDYFMSSGEQKSLVFQSGAVFHTGKFFSSAQVVLQSSTRVVTVRVSEGDGGELTAEKIVDRPAEATQ